MCPAKDVLTGERASRLLFAFHQHHRMALTGLDIEATRLDPRFDEETARLCARIAADPDACFGTEPRQVRALLKTRIVQILFLTMSHPSRWNVLQQLGPMDDRAAMAFLLTRLIAPMKLPAQWHGRASCDTPRGWMN